MITREFWLETAERALKTGAQALLALVSIGATLTDIDWGAALSIAATAVVISILSSIVSAGFGTPDTPSLVRRRE